MVLSMTGYGRAGALLHGRFVLASVGRTKAAATVSGCSVVTYVAYIAWLTTEASTLTQYWFSDTVYYTTAGIVATVFYLRSPWRRKG